MNTAEAKNGFKEFTHKWATPATFIGMITVIIFMVTLNNKTDYNTLQLEVLSETQLELRQESIQAALAIERATVIQQGLIDQLERIHRQYETLTEKMDVQREILLDNRARINNHQSDKHP